MTNQKQEFSFYFNGQRITDCSIGNLQSLYEDNPDAQEIIESILRDKSTWIESLVLQNQEAAKARRSELAESPIELFGSLWQVDKASRDNINEAIAYSKRNELSQNETRQWILADNSVRATTVYELEQVISKYAERLDNIFMAHAEWRKGDKLSGFDLCL